jgi:hypothetical protein
MNTESFGDTQVEVDPQQVDTGTLAVLNRTEIDMQIATAKRYPRSIQAFRSKCMAMVTANEDIAASATYALPRAGKTIEGPSIRFAEMVRYSWTNCRSGARIVSEEDQFITAQSIFNDVENNVIVAFETRRRITNRDGQRYNADMIQTAGSAACAIAARNATLSAIPKALWMPMWEAAKKLAANPKDLVERRAEALKFLQDNFKLSTAQVCKILGVDNEKRIGGQEFATLRAIITALRDEEITVAELLQRAESGEANAGMPRRKEEPEAEKEGKSKKSAKKADSAAPQPQQRKITTKEYSDLANSVAQTVGGGHDEMSNHLKIIALQLGFERATDITIDKLEKAMQLASKKG